MNNPNSHSAKKWWKENAYKFGQADYDFDRYEEVVIAAWQAAQPDIGPSISAHPKPWNIAFNGTVANPIDAKGRTMPWELMLSEANRPGGPDERYAKGYADGVEAAADLANQLDDCSGDFIARRIGDLEAPSQDATPGSQG